MGDELACARAADLDWVPGIGEMGARTTVSRMPVEVTGQNRPGWGNPGREPRRTSAWGRRSGGPHSPCAAERHLMNVDWTASAGR